MLGTVRIRGLVPPRTMSLKEQAIKIQERVLDRCPSDIARGLELQALQDRNETLFYRILIDNIERLAPCVYTPTVGVLCQFFGKYVR